MKLRRALALPMRTIVASYPFAAALLVAATLGVSAQPLDPTLVRTLERDGETFIVAVVPERGVATVSGLLGGVATISPGAGRFDVRLPNGWGGWRDTMPEAVEYAVLLCFEVREQPTLDEVFSEMVDYVRQRSTVATVPD